MAGADVPAKPGVEFRCDSCRRPMVFEDADGWLVCGNSQCAAVGMTVSLWRAEQRRAQAAGRPEATAAGWPRPRDPGSGWPVPWITPVAGGRAWFRLEHGQRLVDCQTGWLCQMCGESLDRRAWVVADRHGNVLSSTAMHRRCLRLAIGACPHLAASTHHVHVEGTREVILADGVPLPAAPTPLVQQRWTLAREVPAGAAAPSATGVVDTPAPARGTAFASAVTDGGTSRVPVPPSAEATRPGARSVTLPPRRPLRTADVWRATGYPDRVRDGS